MDKTISKITFLENEIRRLKVQEVGGVWAAWTPVFTGFSADPTGVVARYCIIGKLCYVNFFADTAGTSNATNFEIAGAPATCGVGTINSLAYYEDNGSGINGAGYVSINSASTTFQLLAEGGNWTASGNKRAIFQIFYEIT